MLRLAQHDKGAERKIGLLSSRAKSRDIFKGLKRKEQLDTSSKSIPKNRDSARQRDVSLARNMTNNFN